jgi:phage-related protein
MAQKFARRGAQEHWCGYFVRAIRMAGRQAARGQFGRGIWEIRSRLPNRIAQTLFAVIDEEIVLLHGFIKKQQRTPPDELALAKKRKKEFKL